MNKRYKKLYLDTIAKALFENYECVYAVDAETFSYRCFYQSDSYSLLRLENQGTNFFDDIENNILRTIYIDDQEYVRKMISKKALINGLKKEKFYSFVYRLVIDCKPLYHKFRATIDKANGHPHYLIGIRNVDKAFRQDKAQAEKLSSMHSKEITHLEAILASSEGYLEANLSKNSIIEISHFEFPEEISKKLKKPNSLSYSEFEKWQIDNYITNNKNKYIEISDRKYLINCFKNGEKRASVSFSMKRNNSQQIRPCKEVFYLYQDNASKDILSFCVLYDLTEQQRKEKEVQDLEQELQMSRLRNFTSQMQPHFLYNSLGSIQEIILDDPIYASELIGDFTTHLRSCIRAMSNDAPIPFNQELENIKAYINIEKMRFGDKLKVVYDIKANDFSILPLSVQPIVENAIRHGIYQKGEKGGTVLISTSESANSWNNLIKDNGLGFDVKQFETEVFLGQRDSTGLKNITFRLDKMMNASVNIDSKKDIGTTVTITIPKEKLG